MQTKHLNIIVFSITTNGGLRCGSSWWIAQCIEHDIATQALTREEVIFDILNMVNARISLAMTLDIKPFDVPPPPPVIVAMFDPNDIFRHMRSIPFEDQNGDVTQWDLNVARANDIIEPIV